MKIVSFILLVPFLCRPALGQAKSAWVTAKSGCEVREGTLIDADNNWRGNDIPPVAQVYYVMVRCDPTSVRISILDTAGVLGKENAYAAYSVREVAKNTGASVVVNAGSTASYSTPIPVGLLIVRGLVISKTNLKATHGAILCVGKKGVTIGPLSQQRPTPKGCSYAVQGGPLLSRDFKEADSNRTRRTIAAIDKKGRLIILVTKSNTFLSSLRSLLYDSSSDLEIQSALNLDGGMSSGIMFAQRGVVGSVDNLVASVIVIAGR